MADLLYAAWLGFVAGFLPVYLGLVPLLYLRRISETSRAVLVSFSAGILLFLFADVTHEGVELASASGSNPALFAVGVVLGFAGPLLVSRRPSRRTSDAARPTPPVTPPPEAGAKLFTAYAMSLGIGLHNLGEGLAIGAAYAGGLFALTVVLVVGFFLHNSTEGLALTAPIASRATGLRHPLLLGFVAGFPTILGSVIGALATSAPFAGLSAAFGALFFAVAAGALLYVILELLKSLAPHRTAWVAVGALLGVLLMYSTGLIAASFERFVRA